MTNASTDTRRALRWLFCIQLLSMGAMEMSGPFWPLHLRTLGQLDAQQLAWASALAYAGPMAMAMCFTPLWGRLGDRVGHKPMLVRALLALVATQLYMAVASHVTTILLARLLQGALAGFIAAAQAYGSQLTQRAERAALMARLQVATALGSILGPVLGGMLYAQLGFATVNVVAAVICAVCLIASLSRLPGITPIPVRPTAPQHNKQGASTLHAIAGLLLAIVLVQSGKAMPQAFFGIYAEQVLHADTTITGLCYGATALGLCLAAPWWARQFDRLSKTAVLARVSALCWMCAALTALQAASNHLLLFVFARLAWGVCLAALLPVFYGLISREVDSTCQGLALGAGNSAAKAGALLGTGAGALAMAWLPINLSFWAVSLLYVLAAACMHWLHQRERTGTLTRHST